MHTKSKGFCCTQKSRIFVVLRNVGLTPHLSEEIAPHISDISKNTTLNAISNLLRFYPMVLVSDGGELKGIITKYDLLGKVYK